MEVDVQTITKITTTQGKRKSKKRRKDIERVEGRER
jgi:hypothetical protein